MTASLGRWILEPLGIYSTFSGVTSNQSESFNAVLKDFEKWKEALVDSAVLSFYYLQVYYYNEIQRGFCGIGTHTLLPEFSYLKCEIDELIVLKAVPPASIVASVRSKTLSNDMVIDNAPVCEPVEDAVSTQYSRARYT